MVNREESLGRGKSSCEGSESGKRMTHAERRLAELECRKKGKKTVGDEAGNVCRGR